MRWNDYKQFISVFTVQSGIVSAFSGRQKWLQLLDRGKGEHNWQTGAINTNYP
jgi:hypothetical protein